MVWATSSAVHNLLRYVRNSSSLKTYRHVKDAVPYARFKNREKMTDDTTVGSVGEKVFCKIKLKAVLIKAEKKIDFFCEIH